MPVLRVPTPEEYYQLVHALNTLRQPLPLDVNQIQALAGRAKIREVLRGDVLMRQGDLPDRLYFILSGQLRASDTSEPEPRVLGYHTARVFIGEQGLLYDKPRAVTIDAISGVRLACWDKADFAWLTGLNERVYPYFEEIYRRRLARSEQFFPGKQPDEVVVFKSGKHILLLANALLGPLLLFLIGLGVLIGLRQWDANIVVIEILAGAPVTVALAWGLFSYFDWKNDEYIVTSKRVIHVERVLLYGEKWSEAPLVRIQDVTVVTRDWLQRMLDYSDVTIKTAGAGDIVFAGVRQAQRGRDLIFQEQTEAVERRAADDKAGIRTALAQKMGRPTPATALPVARPASSNGSLSPVQPRPLPPWIDYLLPRLSVVQGDTITCRKHWFILLRKVALPFVVFIAAMGLTFLALRLGPEWRALAFVSGVGGVLSLFWYALRYDDWRRDIYIVTSNRIIDVKSSAFRLIGETRREGPFDAVQNITYDIPNFLCRLLNMGDVIIQTAGTEKTFMFYSVFDPSAVQQEIFNRWDAFHERRRRRQRESEAQRLADWIGEYHEMQQSTR
jgi:membrane protein YdbS with pleckstrin-like domain